MSRLQLSVLGANAFYLEPPSVNVNLFINCTFS